MEPIESPPLWIVIPCKNEVHTIGRIITGCKNYSDQIVVMDGGSKDGTADKCRALGVTVYSEKDKGKGDAIRKVIPLLPEESIAVFIDADGSHDPNDIPSLLRPIEENRADHVTGSRLIGGSDELHGSFNEFFRLAGSSFITACINRRYNVRLSDSQNGLRAIKTDVLKKLKLVSNSTTIEQEMIMTTLKQGFRMAEVPTHEKRRKHGKSNIRLSTVSWKYGYYLLRGMI